MAGQPAVIEIKKAADERRISMFGGDWHANLTFLPEPPTLLHAVNDDDGFNRLLWRTTLSGGAPASA